MKKKKHFIWDVTEDEMLIFEKYKKYYKANITITENFLKTVETKQKRKVKRYGFGVFSRIREATDELVIQGEEPFTVSRPTYDALVAIVPTKNVIREIDDIKVSAVSLTDGLVTEEPLKEHDIHLRKYGIVFNSPSRDSVKNKALDFCTSLGVPVEHIN